MTDDLDSAGRDRHTQITDAYRAQVLKDERMGEKLRAWAKKWEGISVKPSDPNAIPLAELWGILGSDDVPAQDGDEGES